MTTYYYGIVEFGNFVKDDNSYDTSPIAIIHTLKDVKQFDTPEEAWDYYTTNGKEFESYVAENAEDEDGRTYELLFKDR